MAACFTSPCKHSLLPLPTTLTRPLCHHPANPPARSWETCAACWPSALHPLWCWALPPLPGWQGPAGRLPKCWALWGPCCCALWRPHRRRCACVFMVAVLCAVLCCAALSPAAVCCAVLMMLHCTVLCCHLAPRLSLSLHWLCHYTNCTLLPLRPSGYDKQILENAHRFRLNENLAAALCRASSVAALLLGPALAVAAAVSAAAGSVLPFLVAVGGAAVAAAAAVAASALGLLRVPLEQQRKSKVRMVYAPAGAAAGEAAAPAAQQQQQQQPATVADAAPASSPDGSSSGDGAATGQAEQQLQEPQSQQPDQQQQQPQPRRRSAFSDIDKPPQPQALGAVRGAGLRWCQPQRLQAQRARPHRPAAAQAPVRLPARVAALV